MPNQFHTPLNQDESRQLRRHRVRVLVSSRWGHYKKTFCSLVFLTTSTINLNVSTSENQLSGSAHVQILQVELQYRDFFTTFEPEIP